MKKILTLSRTATFLLASCFLMGFHITAQTNHAPQIPLSIEDIDLNPQDLSGSYVIQTPDLQFMSPLVGTWGELTAIAYTNPNWVMDIVKVSTDTYTIQWGDQKANNKHGWFMGFNNTETVKIFWKITLVSGNTVIIQRSSDMKYLKVETAGAPSLNRFYTDASVPTNFILKTVTSKKPVIFPQASNYTYVRNALNKDDLSGRYLIQNKAGQFMTPNLDTSNDLSIITSVTPSYALTLAKNIDGFYTISSGDFQASYVHPWNLSFDVLPEFNLWTISVVDGDSVTIQRNDNSGYLKNLMNPAITGPFKFYTNASITDDVKYVLQTVTGEVPNGISQLHFTNEIKGNAFLNPSTNELKVTNILNANTISIYNIKGQRICGCKVNASEVSINTKGWNQGIYLLKLSDTNGGYQNIKIIVN